MLKLLEFFMVAGVIWAAVWSWIIVQYLRTR
jgi:hypothetical protein